MMVNAEQPCQRYSGVTRHAGKWLVKLRHRGKDLTIGHYEDPREAAFAADFARYMLFGLEPERWHHNAAKPNFPLGNPSLEVRLTIIRCLLDAEVIARDVLRGRLHEYDAAVQQNYASEALAVRR